ncbi:MAG TPA: hypothetical protein VF466_00955 [Candidatus Saccharimonadales bacterium]
MSITAVGGEVIVPPNENGPAFHLSHTHPDTGAVTTLGFEKFIDSEVVNPRLDQVAAYIAPLMARTKRPEDNIWVPVMAGASQAADNIMQRVCAIDLGIGPEVMPMKVKSYNGTEGGTLDMQQDAPSGFSFEGKVVWLNDETIDGGISMDALVRRVAKDNPLEINIVALTRKPDAHKVPMPPNDPEIQTPVHLITGFDVSNHFLLGMGMDWHGMGRWLPGTDIYRLSDGTPATYSMPPFPAR